MTLRHIPMTCAVLGLVGLSAPAAADTGSGVSQAQVLQPINFALLLELDFGQVIATPSGGTIILDPSTGNRLCNTGGLVCSGSYSVARLVLSGSDALVTVTYAPTLQLTGPGDPMTVTPLFTGGSGAQVQLTGGTATFDFGAILLVNPNQVEGDYTGTFTVNVDYS